LDSALAQLMPGIRSALEADRNLDATPVRSTTPVDDLLPAIREALARDEFEADQGDAQIAKRVAEMLPRLAQDIANSFESARAKLARDAPWALVPLDWELDLLSPLGKARHEPTHTQCLAYLLNWRSPHGLGVRVLREFFALLGRLIPGEDIFERLCRETEENTKILRLARVSAEESVETSSAPLERADGQRRCDVWIELDTPEKLVLLVIENKIDAGEHGDQLSYYEEAVWRRARQRRQLNFEAKLVFLTPEGRAPEQTSDRKLWLSVSYRNLAAALANAGRDAPEPGRSFLQLYVSTILKHILLMPNVVDGVERGRHLPYMTEVIEQGTQHE
jgi:hypothetical protein